MILQKNNELQQERGFTIVELLIVIVVIGILAAITIVAYSGITSRANNTKIQANAANVQKVAEAFNASFGRYPATTVELEAGQPSGQTGSTSVPSGINVVPGQTGNSGAFTTPSTSPLAGLTSEQRQVTIAYSCLGSSCTNTEGGRLYYWDFVNNTQSSTVIYLGEATATSNFTAPSS